MRLLAAGRQEHAVHAGRELIETRRNRTTQLSYKGCRISTGRKEQEQEL